MRNISFPKWLSVLLVVIMASVGGAFSQTLSMADFMIEAGTTKQVSIDLIQGDVPVLAFQTEIVLPEGLTIQGRPKAVAETLDEDETPSVTYSNGKLLVYNSLGLTFNRDAKSIVKLTFAADATFKGGSVTMKDIVISAEGNMKITPADVTAKVTTGDVGPVTYYNITVASVQNGTVSVDKVNAAAGETVKVTATPAEGYELETITVKAGNTVITLSDDFTFVMPAADVTVSATFKKTEVVPVGNPTLFMADFSIETGSTQQVTIDLVQDNTAILAFQTEIVLPEGLTIQGRPKVVSETLEEDETPSATYSNGKLVVYNSLGLTFNRDAKSVVKLTFAADATFKGGTVTLKDIVISAEGNVKITPADVTAKVTSNYVAPTTYTVTVPSVQNGTVTVDKTEVAAGETVKVTATPAQGYELEAITVKAGSTVIALSADNTFVMPAADVTVSATFKKTEVVPVGNPTLFMADFSIEAGSTQQVTIDLVQGDVPVLAFQTEIVLPEGLTIQGRPKAVSETLEEDETPSVTYSNGKLVVYNSLGLTFNKNAKAVLKLTFAADDTFKGGTVTLKDIVISAEGNVKIEPKDVTVKVTSNYVAPTTYTVTVASVQNGTVKVDKSEAAAGETVKVTATPAQGYELETVTVKSGSTVIALSADNTFVMPAAAVTVSATFKKTEVVPVGNPTLFMADFSIDAGSTQQVTIDLVQDNTGILAFQTEIVLPEGLTIQGRPKAVSETLEEDETPSVTYSNGKLVVYNSLGLTFKKNAKSVVKLTFAADATFKGGTVTLKDIVISAEGNVKIEPKDVTVKVTSNYVAPTTYTVTVASVQNGTVKVDKSEAAAGETVKVTATPAQGYELETVTVKSGSTVIALSADNTFVMPAADVTVSATFKKTEVVPVGNPTLFMADFSIEAGSTQQVTIDLVQGDVPVLAFQTEIVLPEGLTIQGRPKAVSETLEEDETPSVTYSNGKLVVYNSLGLTFNKNAKSVVKLTFAADATFKGGTVTLKDIVISAEGNVKIEPKDVTAKVTSSYVGPVTNDPTLFMADFSIDAGSTQQVTIDLVQGDVPVLAFQTEIVLPEGLTIQGRPKAVAETLEEDETPSVTYSNGKLVVYNSLGLTFNKNAKSVVKLTFAADATFKGGTVTLKDIVISAEGNVKITPKDVTAKATLSSVVPTTYAITVATSQNGTVTVDKTEAAAGETVKVTATPAQGYELEAVTVKSGSTAIALSDDFTFVMPAADVTVNATFKKTEVIPTDNPTLFMADFSIEAGSTQQVTIDLVQGDVPVLAFQTDIVLPEGLTIQGRPKAVSETLEEDETPSVTYSNGKLVVYNSLGLTFKKNAKSILKLTFAADATFKGGTVTLKDIVISAEGNVKIEPKDVTAKVTSNYVAPTTYTVTVASVQNGTVKVDKSEAAAGETVKVTATPAEGYELETITVKAGSTVIALSADNTFVMPASDVTVSATFKKTEVIPTDNPTLFMADFSIEAGSTQQVTIDLVQGDVPVLAFQTEIVLPEGLTIQGRPKAVSETLEEDETPSVTYSNGKLVVYNSLGLTFNKNAKSVVKLTFAADDTFKGGNVTLKDIVISAEGNVKITPADVTAKATVGSIVPTTYAVTVATAQNGTVIVDKTEAEAGETVKVTATPAEGYELEAITVKAGSTVIALSDNFTFVMPAADVTVTATFKEIPVIPTTYAIMVADVENGTVTVDKTTAKAGETVKVTATPAEGYEIQDVTVKAGSSVITLSADLTFTMPAADVTVTATFKKKQVVPTDKPTLAMSDFTMDASSTQQVTIDLVQGDISVLGFQTELVLPTGLTVQGRPKAVAETLEEDLTPTVTYANGKLVVYNSDGLTFKKNAKAVVTITFAADADFNGGNITLKDIVISGEGNVKIKPQDVTATVMLNPIQPTTYAITVANVANGTVTVDKTNAAAGETIKINAVHAAGYKLESITVSSASGNIELSADLTFTMPAADVTVSAKFTEAKLSTVSIADFTIKAGETKQVTIDLTHGDNPIIGFVCNINLPEGLTINGTPTAVSGTLTDASGKPLDPVVSFTDGKLIVGNTLNLLFNDDATGIITIEFTASDDFEAGYITLSNIVILEQGNVVVSVADTKTKVNDPVGIAELRTNARVDVYTLNGTRILTKATVDELHLLPRGTYIVNGKKVLLK